MFLSPTLLQEFLAGASGIPRRPPAATERVTTDPITGQKTYKAHRPWPPDFSLLTPKHKFALERRYRRRTKLKWERPRLQKVTQITQWTGIAIVLAYGVLWQDWGERDGVTMPIRNWIKDQFAGVSIWSTPAPERKAEEVR